VSRARAYAGVRGNRCRCDIERLAGEGGVRGGEGFGSGLSAGFRLGNNGPGFMMSADGVEFAANSGDLDGRRRAV